MPFAIEAAKNTMVISQVSVRRDPLGLKALSSYVEVTSFKLIGFSAFWAKWRRVACR